MREPILVTGAAGFIGSHLVAHLRGRWPPRRVVSLDALTYAGRRENLASFDGDPGHIFVQADVTDAAAIQRVFAEHRPSAVCHLAAETHVDRSVLDPLTFAHTNLLGTAVLLSAARAAWGDREDVRYVQISTDEVFGALGPNGRFDEDSPYAPRSPYSASKAGADHLVRAWWQTYGFPTMVTIGSNAYGPRQFPEKLVPVVIARTLADEPVPVYGTGKQVRDWLYVGDHCAGIADVLERGTPGATYCLGGGTESTNLDWVYRITDAVDHALGRADRSSRDLVRFVTDRPGHDFRYALDASRAASLGWRAEMSADDGIEGTVAWYLAHRDWLERARAAGAAFERRWYAR